MTTYESPNRHWWDDHDNIVTLAYWMRERDHGVDDFVSLIEKPWKWTTEFEQATADNEESQALFDQDAAEAEIALDAAIGAQEAEDQAGLLLRSETYKKWKREQEFKAGFDEVRPADG